MNKKRSSEILAKIGGKSETGRKMHHGLIPPMDAPVDT